MVAACLTLEATSIGLFSGSIMTTRSSTSASSARTVNTTKSTRKRSKTVSGAVRPHVLKNEADYDSALAHVESLMNARRATKRGEELELWVCLVEQYEREHFPIDPPDPTE